MVRRSRIVAPTKMEAASAARNGETYYVERAEYASGTAVFIT